MHDAQSTGGDEWSHFNGAYGRSFEDSQLQWTQMVEFGLDWRKLPMSDTQFGKLFIKYDDLGTSSAQNLGQRHCKNEMSRGFVLYSNYRYGLNSWTGIVDSVYVTITSLSASHRLIGGFKEGLE